MAGLALALAACGGNVVVDGDGRSGGVGGTGSTSAAATSTASTSNTTGTAATGAGGSGAGGAATTLNPDDKADAIVLSNGNLSATSAIGSVNDSVRATTSKQTGKWYFEVYVHNVFQTYFAVGIADSAADLELGAGSSSFGCGYNHHGAIECHENEGFFVVFAPEYTGGDVIGVAVDMDETLLYFTLNGDWVLGEPKYFNGIKLEGPAMFPMVTVSENDSLTVNFGASPFVYAAPSGFNPGW